MLRREVTISVSASEKLSPAPYESIDRTVILSERIEFDADDLGREEDLIAGEIASLQMRAEAQMYAALSRGMGSHGQKTAFLRAAALDRSKRIAPEDFGKQCDAGDSEKHGDAGVIR